MIGAVLQQRQYGFLGMTNVTNQMNNCNLGPHLLLLPVPVLQKKGIEVCVFSMNKTAKI